MFYFNKLQMRKWHTKILFVIGNVEPVHDRLFHLDLIFRPDYNKYFYINPTLLILRLYI